MAIYFNFFVEYALSILPKSDIDSAALVISQFLTTLRLQPHAPTVRGPDFPDRSKIYEIGKLTAIKKAISCQPASLSRSQYCSRWLFLSGNLKCEKITHETIPARGGGGRIVPLAVQLRSSSLILCGAERNRTAGCLCGRRSCPDTERARGNISIWDRKFPCYAACKKLHMVSIVTTARVSHKKAREMGKSIGC
jgi:hypothetical protein